ncbi:MAG: hypothetical protein KDC79_08060 [Cyclobacteriaceae bacterium]|nr:hypothetical protein [Cyclobacteriaceae bacterium]
MRRKVFLLLNIIFLYSFAQAQSITPKGEFLKDSIQIGEPVAYSLVVRYPKFLEVVFPDSLYNFSPFELTKKVYFPTRSDSTYSVDSAVYYLSTFEIDTVQYLKMPVYLVNEFDSTTLWTGTDSVILKQVVEAIPDSLAMKTNTKYVEVPMEFNYPYYSIGLGALVLLLVIVWLVFGKTIRKRVKINRLKKRYSRFTADFDYKVEKSFNNCEAILKLWKAYMETVSDAPYKKLTSKEIIQITKDKSIEEALIHIDRNIYGPKDESLLADAYQKIKEMAIRSYHQKIEEISNG